MIRQAQEKDIDKILKLLSQVLEIHAKIRPDIFVSGTTKYTKDELKSIIENPLTPVYVAVGEPGGSPENDDEGEVLGYAFCILKEQPFSTNMVPFRSLYIDDLCVDEKARGRHIGSLLLDHVRQQAKSLGCYEITLCVWEGNDPARRFYDMSGFKVKETVMEMIL